jgi:hypothetical protein
VEYIISSRGRPIGTTELDFTRIDDSSRSGFFHPNALGEELMPTVALVYPAMCAYVCRNVRDADGHHIVRPDFRRSSLFGDLAEALHRVDSLDLTLHHADGRLIPTSLIGIQDTDRLLELARWRDVCPEHNPSVDDDDPECDFELAVEDDLELPPGSWQEIDDDDLETEFDDGWVPDEVPVELPRYQVHVLLSEKNAI